MWQFIAFVVGWFIVSVPVALVLGRWLRAMEERP